MTIFTKFRILSKCWVWDLILLRLVGVYYPQPIWVEGYCHALHSLSICWSVCPAVSCYCSTAHNIPQIWFIYSNWSEAYWSWGLYSHFLGFYEYIDWLVLRAHPCYHFTVYNMELIWFMFGTVSPAWVRTWTLLIMGSLWLFSRIQWHFEILWMKTDCCFEFWFITAL